MDPKQREILEDAAENISYSWPVRYAINAALHEIDRLADELRRRKEHE